MLPDLTPNPLLRRTKLSKTKQEINNKNPTKIQVIVEAPVKDELRLWFYMTGISSLAHHLLILI